MLVKTALVICALTILSGPFYTEPGYSVISHSISELAGQDTQNAWIMRLGLIALGGAAIAGFLRKPNRLNLSFLIFGICMVLTAAFPHKPFVENRPYSVTLDNLHSVFASLGGFSAVMGFILLGVNKPGLKGKILYFSVAAAYTVLPMLMFAWPVYQGIFQRLIFTIFIVWSFLEYPVTLPDPQAGR